MSTLTRSSSLPYTGPAPTNRLPYVPKNAEAIDARAEAIAAKIGGGKLTPIPGHDAPTFSVARESILAALEALRDDTELAFTMPLDLFGIDYPGRTERFDVVYHLLSIDRGERIRLIVRTDETTPLPSALGIFEGFDWFEREVFDMFGVRFEGHYNLRRILCHEAFQGHALRKDYDPGQRWLLTEKDVAKLNPIVTLPPEHHDFEHVTLNIGPSHPATHGTLRMAVTLDGEKIVGMDTEIGYLHRCFEKMCETHSWQQAIPFTDRLNYCSAYINNVGYAMAVEKLLGIEAPARAQHVRLILSEFARISDHFVCVGANLVDLGALTNFWYLFQPREEILQLFENCCGARLLPSYIRIGGLPVDVPHDFLDQCQRLVDMIPKYVGDVERLITRNRIFHERTEGIGPISAKDAIRFGFTGPCLRAAGVPYDVRLANPYLGYDTYDWDVPVADGGDTYARYLVRMEEIRQSVRIIQQAIRRGLPDGPVMVDDPYVALPPKERVYNEMESLIYHFKLIMHGIQPPIGQTYFQVEGANGEVGFYIVSDGTKNPYRVRVRPPCFAIYQAFRHMIVGQTVPDLISALGSLNIIAGELDH